MVVTDGSTDQVLLVGGDTSKHLSVTLLWNGSRWTEPGLSQNPPALSYESMAYDARTGDVILFGGLFDALATNNPPSGETWSWDGTAWSELHPAQSPPPRAGATMTYDGRTGSVVLFGGNGAPPGQFPTPGDTGLLNDTWVWNGTDWREEHPAVSPPARQDAAMGYASSTGDVVLFGGFADQETPDSNLVYLGDTWVWDGTNWSRASQADGPPSRGYSTLAPDSTSGDLVLFSGWGDGSFLGPALDDTWVWSDGRWTQESGAGPPGFGSPLVVPSLTGGGITLLGGETCGVGNSGLIDIWTRSGNSWARTIGSTATPGSGLMGC